MTEKWLKQRDAPVPVGTYCPVNIETGKIMIGLTYIGEPDGDVVGEFWYEKGEIKVELYPSSLKGVVEK